MRRNERSNGRRTARGWWWMALLAAWVALAPPGVHRAEATSVAAEDGAATIAAVAPDGSATLGAADPVEIDNLRRQLWGSAVCGLARFIGKLDPSFGESAMLICQFIESLDGH